MPSNDDGNGSNGNHVKRTVVSSFTEITYEGGDVFTEIQRILSSKRTGTLTLHVASGGVAQAVWKERDRKPADSPSDAINYLTRKP